MKNIIFSVLLFVVRNEALLLGVEYSCDEGSVAYGPCHNCNCSNGIYKCEYNGCISNNDMLSLERECKPKRTYNYGALYCTCTSQGKWRSPNCRHTFKKMYPNTQPNSLHEAYNPMHPNVNYPTSEAGFKSLSTNVSLGAIPNYKDLPEIYEGEDCIPGHIYKMSCNTCKCGSNSSLICTKMACFTGTLNKAAEVKEKVKKLRQGEEKGKGSKLPNLPTRGCKPGKIYKKNCQKCFCTSNENTICLGSCKEKISHLISDQDIIQITAKLTKIKLSHIGAECHPGNGYDVDCNSCLCSHNHDLVCTKYLCLDTKLLDYPADKLTGEPCTEDFVRDCVNCKCINKKTKCSVLKSCMAAKGKSFNIPSGVQKLSLDGGKDKCEPNAAYKFHCNHCFCQSDGSLRCTQKYCLKHSQILSLQKRFKYLEEQGL